MKILQRLFISIFVTGFSLTTISAATFEEPAEQKILTLKSVYESQDENIDELVKTAFELYQQKKFDEALANCTKASDKSPKDFRPRFLAGLIYMAQWKMKSASEEFAKASSLSPNNKQIYLLKARADYLRNEREAAVAASRKALEIDPSFAEAHAMIGEILVNDEKRRDEAIAAYRAALKINPELLSAYEGLGRLLISTKDEKAAEEILRKGMAAEKKEMDIRFTLGRMLVKQGRLKEARTIWEGRTSDKDRTFPNFITVLERAEKLKQATTALAQKPKDPEMLVQMGFATMEGDSWVVDGRQERAIEYFKKALELKPDFAKAQYGICKAYIQLADTFNEKKKNVDEELTKLSKLDTKLADEMKDYLKNYSGGLKGTPAPLNQ